jgi:hypothetical protein
MSSAIDISDLPDGAYYEEPVAALTAQDVVTLQRAAAALEAARVTVSGRSNRSFTENEIGKLRDVIEDQAVILGCLVHQIERGKVPVLPDSPARIVAALTAWVQRHEFDSAETDERVSGALARLAYTLAEEDAARRIEQDSARDAN